MADVGSSIFNKKAADKLRSPDDLDKYVRVTNPSAWAVVAACLALLVGLLAWGMFGAVSTSVSTTGVVINEQPMCFLKAEDVAKVHVGDVAYFGGERMAVSDVAAVPDSRDEAKDVLKSDYLVSSLMQDDWVYLVKFIGDAGGLAENIPQTVNITTERIAPISLILGGAA